MARPKKRRSSTRRAKKSGKKVLEAYGRSIVDPVGAFEDVAKRYYATEAVSKAGAAGFKAGKALGKHPESRRRSKD